MQQFSPYRTQQYPPQYINQPIYQSAQNFRPPEDIKKQPRQQTPSQNSEQQLEKKLNLLVQENKECTNLLKQKCEELERTRVQNSEMECELNKLRGIENELDVTKEMAELRHKEGNKLRQKCNQLEKDLRNAQNSLVELENKKKVLNQEVSQWKTRFTELDQERLKQLEQTRYTLESIKQQECENLKQKSIQKMNELERNMEIMSCEYDKIKAQVKQKKQEIDGWKIKYSKLEVKYNNEVQKQEIQQNGSDDKDDLENKIQMLIGEIERLNGVVQGKNEEIERFRRLLEQTAQQIPLFQEKNKQFIILFKILKRDLVQENKKLKKDQEMYVQEIETMKKSMQTVQSMQ